MIEGLKFKSSLDMYVKGKSIEWRIDNLVGESVDRWIGLEVPDFNEFSQGVFSLAEEVWPDIKPLEAKSEASDYYEYYDKEYDNNGYLTLNPTEKSINVTQVAYCESRVYKFNKRKMQSFLFDLQEVRDAW